MENKTPNTSIECSVKQCQNHCQSEDYCTLKRVKIATHESNPTQCQCIDCQSFVKKSENG
ncbi:MAG TPA: DUF1540 domain-containing protein [Firmicutes bacterium]|nr:DUF1540 domain-containing protein [Bacillota bacterium]